MFHKRLFYGCREFFLLDDDDDDDEESLLACFRLSRLIDGIWTLVRWQCYGRETKLKKQDSLLSQMD